MHTLLETQDPVLLSFAQAVLRDAGIESQVLDANISIMEGSIGILPRRLVVADRLQTPARQALADADLEEHLKAG